MIETESNFPKKICCTVWGDMLPLVNNLKPGEKVVASIDIESRQYNDRWYTDVKAWQIKPLGEESTPPSGLAQPATAPPAGNRQAPPEDDGSDDLPF